MSQAARQGLLGAGNDRQVEAAALLLLLEEHPSQLTVEEIVNELVGTDAEFAARDQVERAIGVLTRMGVAHERDSVVFPSRATRYLYGLEAEGFSFGD